MDPNLTGHLANLLFAASYLVRDILWLRAISIVACAAAIVFNFLAPESPLWVAIYWNIFFMGVNCVQIYRVVRERNNVSLSPAEYEVYQLFFDRLTPFEFFKLIKASKWIEFVPGNVLVHRGEAVSHVYLIYNGEVLVRSDQTLIATLRDGSFVGEAGFVSDEVASASVEAVTPLRCFAWSANSLKTLFSRNPTLESSFVSALGVDLAKKLRNDRTLLLN